MNDGELGTLTDAVNALREEISKFRQELTKAINKAAELVAPIEE